MLMVEIPLWIGWAAILLLLAETVVGVVLIVRVRALVRDQELSTAQQTADRQLTRELLTTVKGWATLMERKEDRKAEKIQQVVDDAVKATCEVKAAIVQATAEVKAATALVPDKVVEKLSTSTSDSTVTLPRPALS